MVRVYPQVVRVTSVVGRVVMLLIIGTLVSGTSGKPSVRRRFTPNDTGEQVVQRAHERWSSSSKCLLPAKYIHALVVWTMNMQ